MKIKGLTLEQIKAAAKEAGHFKLDNVRSIGNYHLFVLRMASGTPSQRERKWMDRQGMVKLDDEGAAKYGDLATRMEYRKRGIGNMMWGHGPEYGIAVCFHGFEAFMWACFDKNPKAIIRTCRAAYLGLEDFEEKYPTVGSQNVGSQMCPIQYRECCDC